MSTGIDLSPIRQPLINQDALVLHVPFGQRHVARWLFAARGLGPRLAALESAVLRDAIDNVDEQPPLWVCGMARAGSTLLLEAIVDMPGHTAHHYGDYPWLWTPYWRNWLRQRMPGAPSGRRERTHGDRLLVNASSPEAFEEIFWMHFLPGRHDAAVDQRVAADFRDAAFERHFDDHRRKLLSIRGATRYVAKANYQLARIAWLHARHPQARFVIPVRDPVGQVASLVGQHRLFCRLHDEDPAVGAHLARVGHFEFGPQRRVHHLGDVDATRMIEECFARGDDAAGYARQWAVQYGQALDAIEQVPTLGDACLWVRYDRLCADPRRELVRIARFIGIADEACGPWLTRWAGSISAPTSTREAFDPEALSDIAAATDATWQRVQALPDPCRLR